MGLARFSALCVAVAMVFSSAVSITSVRAVDTSNAWFTPINGDPGMEFYDAEWGPDGGHALWVGYDGANGRGTSWWYNPLDDGWHDVSVTTGEADGLMFESVEFWNDRMVVMGECGVTGAWFYTDPSTNVLVASTDADLVGAQIYDLTSIGGTMFAAGQSAGGYALTWFNNGTGWATGWGDATKSDSKYYGMDWYAWGPDVVVYMAGSYDDGGTTRGLMQAYNVTPMSMSTISETIELAFTDIELDSSVPESPRFLLTASQRGPGTYGIYAAETSGGPTFHHLVGYGTIPTVDGLQGIDVDQYGTAVAVGSNPTHGVVYNLWRTGLKTTVLIRSDTSGFFAGNHFKDVRIRPYGVQMALTVGSSFRYSYTSVTAPIQVDTSVPHISYIHLFAGDDVGTSRMNSQIDVDAGVGTTYYTLSVCFWNSLGIDHVEECDVWMWYDMGLINADRPGAFDDAALANQRMRFSATNGGPAPALDFPLTGETTLTVSTWEESLTYAWVNLTFVPHEQVRWADSVAGAWNQGAATDRRYDGLAPFGVWNAEDQSDNSGYAPLDEMNTWDIKVQIQDDATVTNYAQAYDEFGFFKYTYLGSENIANGGSVYGSGAPNVPNVALAPSNVDVTFCANCPYSLGVTLHSVLDGVATADFIPSENIALQGGDLDATAFGAAPSTQYLIGGGPLQESLGSGTTTTTSSYDGNADSDAVFWWCDIPAVAEDQYVAQITWAINN